MYLIKCFTFFLIVDIISGYPQSENVLIWLNNREVKNTCNQEIALNKSQSSILGNQFATIGEFAGYYCRETLKYFHAVVLQKEEDLDIHIPKTVCAVVLYVPSHVLSIDYMFGH